MCLSLLIFIALLILISILPSISLPLSLSSQLSFLNSLCCSLLSHSFVIFFSLNDNDHSYNEQVLCILSRLGMGLGTLTVWRLVHILHKRVCLCVSCASLVPLGMKWACTCTGDGDLRVFVLVLWCGAPGLSCRLVACALSCAGLSSLCCWLCLLCGEKNLVHDGSEKMISVFVHKSHRKGFISIAVFIHSKNYGRKNTIITLFFKNNSNQINLHRVFSVIISAAMADLA